MTLRQKIITALTISLAGILLAAAHRPSPLVHTVNLPDDSRTLPLYQNVTISQQITTPDNSLSGITLFLADPLEAPDSTTLILHIRYPSEDKDIRTVITTLGQTYTQDIAMTPTPEKESVLGEHFLHFPFEAILDTQGKMVKVAIEAPELPKDTALLLRREIDGTKYPDHELTLNGDYRPGDLGFVTYENPSTLNLVGRWITDSENVAIWPAIALLAIGMIGIIRYKQPNVFATLPQSEWWQRQLAQITLKEIFIASVILTGIIFVFYYPALHLFFFQDDISILLRVKTLAQDPLKLIFTNHTYILSGDEPAHPIGFYRPISYSLFPLLTYTFFGLSAIAHHLTQLILFSIAASLIYAVTRLFGISRLLAFSGALIWLSLSSKADIAYWISSAQDVIAVIFILLAILTYARFRSNPSWNRFIVWSALFALALLSKESAIVFPVIVVFLELFALSQNRVHISQLKSHALTIGAVLLIIGAYLVIRTIALGDPTLPPTSHQDTSYDISLSPVVITKNILSYAAWTAESHIWGPALGAVNTLETPLRGFLKTEAATPLYVIPGLICMGVYIAAFFLYRKNRPARYFLIFIGIWWIAFIGPQLLLANERNPRWLTLSTWSLSALFVALIHYSPRLSNFQKNAIALIVIAAAIPYGYYTARSTPVLQKYEHHSENARHVVDQFADSPIDTTNTIRIVFVGTNSDDRGTINRDLLHLFFDIKTRDSLYVDSPPPDPEQDDVVIRLE